MSESAGRILYERPPRQTAQLADEGDYRAPRQVADIGE